MKGITVADLIDCSGHEADLKPLLAACRDFFALHHLGDGETPSLEVLLRDLGAPYRQRTHLLGLRGPDGEYVALVVLVKDWQRPRQWCLRVMLVHPDLRGQGIGSQLYDAVVAWSKGQGAAAMLIGVLADNHAALRFWQRHSFQTVRETSHTSGSAQLELEHRFCDVPIAKVVQPGRTLAKHLRALSSR